MNRLANIQMMVLIVLLGATLGLALFAVVTGRGTTHQQILVRLESVERESKFQSCLLLILPEARDELAVAGCLGDSGPTP